MMDNCKLSGDPSGIANAAQRGFEQALLIAVADSYKKPAGFFSNACGLLQSQVVWITKVQPNPVKQITTANAKPVAFTRQE